MAQVMENSDVHHNRNTMEGAKDGVLCVQIAPKAKHVMCNIVDVDKEQQKSGQDHGKCVSDQHEALSLSTSCPSLSLPASSSPPTTVTLWEPQKVENAASAGAGDGLPLEEQLSHPEVLMSSPGSDAETGTGTPDFLFAGTHFHTPVKTGSVNTEAATMMGTTLRHVLSDPVTGSFMEDAMVATCGHSFGSTSLNTVRETGKCMQCGASVPADSLFPNYALRAAVHAFKREDCMWQLSSIKAAKRRREQIELSEGSEGKRLARDPLSGEQTALVENSRPRGVQFPFAVSDQVLIKGNKRTPERFVGREAIITTQCLNGWYLVRTLDNGESVRLQYRSLQKLGGQLSNPEMSDTSVQPLTPMLVVPDSSLLKYILCNDLCASKDVNHHMCAEVEKRLETGSSPEMGSARKAANGSELKAQPALSKTDDILETGKMDGGPGTVAHPAMPVKGMRTETHKKPRRADLTRSVEMAATSSTPSAGASSTSSLDMQSDGRLIGPRKAGEVTKVVDHSEEDDPYDMKPTVSPPSLNGKLEGLIEKLEGASDGGQLRERPQVWDSLVEAKDLHKPHESLEVESITEVVPVVEAGDSFTIRSKRSVLSTRGPGSSLGVEPDPYRKVYSSSSRRRGVLGEGLMSEPLITALVDSKPLTKNITGIERARQKWVSSDHPSADKLMREAVAMPNIKEILAIMRKDILNLEKQIPWNCLVKSWKTLRINWRKGVKESCTVQELGVKVKVFRSSLLLTTAGGITNEEWARRIRVAMETDDVELLVSLWGRLYDDVYKWVQSKPKRVHEGIGDTNLVDTFAELRKQFPQLHVAGLSPAGITTAATLAAADAIAERHLDANALLAVPLKLLQQHSRGDLLAVREALGREKRHLAAKLAQLEANETRDKEEDLVAGFLERGTPVSGQVSVLSVPSAMVSSFQMEEVEQRGQGDDTDDGESDAINGTRDADGEATDMSDSD